jgi:transketolase
MRDLAGLFAWMTPDEEHQRAAASTLDVLWMFYERVLDSTPDDIEDPGRVARQMFGMSADRLHG